MDVLQTDFYEANNLSFLFDNNKEHEREEIFEDCFYVQLTKEEQ